MCSEEENSSGSPAWRDENSKRSHGEGQERKMMEGGKVFFNKARRKVRGQVEKDNVQSRGVNRIQFMNV